MIIKRIEIDGFGKFSGATFQLGDGFNLVFGNNEDGKTTLMSFIKMMFYSSSSKTEKATDLFKSLRKKYRPWNGSPMQGAIEFEFNDMEYRLQKEFLKSEVSDKTTVFCKTTGESLNIENGNEAGIYFFGMTLDEFERSVFIGQSGGFSADSASDSLAMRISNLTVSGDEGVSHELILKRLSDAIEELVSKSRKKGLIVAEEQKLADLKFEEQKLIRLEDEQKELELKIAHLEGEISKLEECLNSVSDGQQWEAAKKELNAFYALHNKQNLLKAVKNQLALYDADENLLREYAQKATALNKEIESSIILIQEATASKSATTISDEEYARISALDQKATDIRCDLALINDRIKDLYNELTAKRRAAAKAAKWTSLIPFSIGLALAVIVFLSNPIYLTACAGILGLGIIITIVMLCTVKQRASCNLSVQLAKRDFEGALRELSVFSEDMLQKAPDEIASVLSIRLSDTVSSLSEELSRYHCSNINQLRKQSAAAQAENIQAISEQLSLQKEEFIALACTVKAASSYSAAKILYVELCESLDSLEKLTAEIETICTATGISNISPELVDKKIRELGEFIENAPKAEATPTVSVEAVRKELKEKRLVLSEYQSKLVLPPRSLNEVARLIEEAERSLARLNARYNELVLAFEVMNEAILDTNKGLGSHLSEKVGRYLNEISAGRYSDIIVPRDLSLEVRDNVGQGYHEWKYLSSGAIDRVYLCLRLAITDILAQDKEPLPLFFDDILANYDDESCKTALIFIKEYLKNSSSASQVMFFTCHSHIKELSKNIFENCNEISL